MDLIINGNKFVTTEIIRDLKFYTKNGQSIPLNNHSISEAYTEQFDGYTLGYATGRKSLLIDQLQFFWYRTI
jgi:hypothetical protein